MNITLEELAQEMQNQFPKEFTICVQAIQIRKLQEQQESNNEPENNSTISD